MSGPAPAFAGLRVAVIGPFPPREGELSSQSELLSRSLEAEGCTVRRVNTDAPAVRRLPRLGLHLLPLAQVLAVLRRLLAAAWRSDVLHVLAASDWGFYLPVGLAVLVGRLARRRVVVTCAGGALRTFVGRGPRGMGWLLARVDGIAAPSRYAADILGQAGWQTMVVPHLLDLDALPRAARSAWPPLILWLGELEPHARPEVALQALAALRAAHPHVRLLLVGAGSLAAETATLAGTLGVREAVAYRAGLSTEQRRDALRQTSVLWHTADEDNLPQIVLEAAACGAVVVAADVGGIGEWINHGVEGLLVAPGDAAALAEATGRVLSRPFLAESLAANARLSVERLAWGRQRRKLAALYGLEPAPAQQDEDDAGDDGQDDVLAHTEFLWSEPAPR